MAAGEWGGGAYRPPEPRSQGDFKEGSHVAGLVLELRSDTMEEGLSSQFISGAHPLCYG